MRAFFTYRQIREGMRPRTLAAAGLVTAVLTLVGCSKSSDVSPAPTNTVTVVDTKPTPLTEEEHAARCTAAVAAAAPDWDDWNIPYTDWEADPRTPVECVGLDNLAWNIAMLDGLDQAAACDTPEALPNRC